MAKVKSIVDNDQIRLYGTLDSNLNGTYFNNTASQTIFSFGSFVVTSNFEGRKSIDYSNQLSSFVRPVTLETMGVTDIQSAIILKTTTDAVLNLDKSDLNTFVRFGSAYEFLRVTIQNIILAYPASIYVNSQTVRGGNITLTNFNYNSVTNISTFKVPTAYTVNMFGIVTNAGNQSIPDNNELKNLNLSYDKYIIWSAQNSTGNSYSVIGFTGYSSGNKFLTFRVKGNPFPTVGGTSGSIDFHIKPNNLVFEEFRALLSDYEKYILSVRDGTNGFKFTMKDPILLEDTTINYSDAQLLWATSDGYNIDISSAKYRNFLESVLGIGSKYDSIKTDLIARFLTPLSLKTYDLTEEGKMTKLLRLYGREFDELKEFIDSLVNINRVTYDKVNNIPDQLIKNLARVFGWNYFSLVNENELVESFLTINDKERNLNTDLMPAEIDIELWRRIIMNTNYFWKSKGTRESIKSIFLLIGIPEPFINITEYVYTVDGKINPNTVTLSQIDFPSNSLPYDTDGYPIAPLETNNFYFQVSGDTDSGQAYMDVFRMAGFDLTPVVDNKKSWLQAGSITRVDDTTPQYNQEDSRLVLNTKEVDVALDTARGIEYDVYRYIQDPDFKYNSSGYTLPFSYVNISLNYTGTQNTFQLPTPYNITEGDLEIRYNGILLNAPKTGLTITTYQADYTVTGNSFTIRNGNYAINSGNRRDVIQATFIYSGTTHSVSGITVQYIVTRVNANSSGTIIPLPSYPRGDVQVTIEGIALTKGTPQFIADYILDPANSISGTSNIIIQNPEAKLYLAVNPMVQVAYVQVVGSNEINARSEVVRVDSFNSGKIYFNVSANKYVYKLNYKANQASDIKVLVDGIALEPNMDYSINSQNLYEVFLPKGIKYGTVISVYYLVAQSSFFSPIVGNSFGVGDISQLSFLEFIELIQRRLINARNRKTITDFKGGWYPSLLRIYIEYLKRADLPDDDLFQSNGYTFENLYSFLSKYNAFFQRFVDELLSATIILKKSGLLIRNSVFTKQKFTYKRGTNVSTNNRTLLQYFGDDGSMFLVDQNIFPPVPPPTLHVDTKVAIADTLGQISGLGGEGIIGYTGLTEYGIQYRINPSDAWTYIIVFGALPIDNFTLPPLTGLLNDTTYMYRAYIVSGAYGYVGDTLYITTLPAPIIPSIQTRLAGSIGQNSINNTGGINIVEFASIDYYKMQYRPTGTTTWLSTTPLSGPLGVDNYTLSISGLSANTYYQYRAYMIVGGTEYFGDIRIAHTSAIPLALPIVITSGITSIGQTSGMGGGLVTNAGYPATVIHRGVVWGLAPNPTTGNSKTVNGSGLGSFVSSITGLTSNTTYNVRAYATNSTGTAYGSQVSFLTLPPPKNINLHQTYYNNGDGSSCSCREFCICSTPAMNAGESYCLCLYADLCDYGQATGSCAEICVACNGICKLCCCITVPQPCGVPSISFPVAYGDYVTISSHAYVANTACPYSAASRICLAYVTSISGSFVQGTTCNCSCTHTG